MSVTNAASVTYHRQKSLRGRPGCACGEVAGQSPRTPEQGRKPFVLPEPTNPNGDLEEIFARYQALAADEPEMSDKEWQDLFQRHTNRPLFRDS